MNKIILFELNEVPLRIFDYYIRLRPKSWLATTYPRLKKYETFNENTGYISPWDTWATLHRGVDRDTHLICDFNQDLSQVNEEYPAVWDILTKNGIKTGIFGSLHTYPIPQNLEHFHFYVPDIFAPNHECFPKEVEFFQKINLRLSRKSSRNVDSSIAVNDVYKMLTNIRNLGFKPNTLMGVAGQLAAERSKSWKTARRRTFQMVLSFDIYYKLLKKHRPDFSTFFTNHVASNLHRFWAAVFPDDYDEFLYEQKWVNTYSNEILFAMDYADAMLKKLARFVDKQPDFKLIITSSMGQKAFRARPMETQVFITHHERFMKAMGVSDRSAFEVLPAMSPQFNYNINKKYHATFKENLDQFSICGKKVNYRQTGNMFSLDFRFPNLTKIDIRIGDTLLSLEETGCKNVKIKDRSSTTANHIPEGHLFSYHPTNKVSDIAQEQLPVCDILPILMNNFGIKKRSYMNDVKLWDI